MVLVNKLVYYYEIIDKRHHIKISIARSVIKIVYCEVVGDNNLYIICLILTHALGNQLRWLGCNTFYCNYIGIKIPKFM